MVGEQKLWLAKSNAGTPLTRCLDRRSAPTVWVVPVRFFVKKRLKKDQIVHSYSTSPALCLCHPRPSFLLIMTIGVPRKSNNFVMTKAVLALEARRNGASRSKPDIYSPIRHTICWLISITGPWHRQFLCRLWPQAHYSRPLQRPWSARF